MARTIHEVLDSDRELYNEYRNLTDNTERLDEMAAIMEGCGYAAEYNLMRRSLNLSRRMMEFERKMQ